MLVQGNDEKIVEKCGKCGGPKPMTGHLVQECMVNGHCPECHGLVTVVKVRTTITPDGKIQVIPFNHPRPTKVGLLTAATPNGRPYFHKGNCFITYGPRGGVETREENWRGNGRMQTWVTRPEEFSLPIKYGHRGPHGYVTHANTGDYHLASECLCEALPRDRKAVLVALSRATGGGPLEPEEEGQSLVIDCTLYFPKAEEVAHVEA